MTNSIVFYLSLLGMQAAGYLTLAHLHLLALVCLRGSGCVAVARNPLAHGFGLPALAPVPTAAFGLLLFGALAVLCGCRAAAPSARVRWALGVLQWGLSGLAVLGSLWLTFVEAYLIRQWCPWCLLSAGATAAIFLTLSGELLLAARPAVDPPQASLPRGEMRRLALALLVVMLFDGGAVLALRRAQAAQVAPVKVADAIAPSPLSSELHRYGNPAAANTLVEFGDYACPHCQAAEPAVERLLARYPRTLNFVFHYCPIADEPDDMPALAARAAEVAAREGKFWPMHVRLFATLQTQDITPAWTLATARRLDLDSHRFQRELNSAATRNAIRKEEQMAEQLQVNSVPTFFFTGADGKTLRFKGIDGLTAWLANPAHWR